MAIAITTAKSERAMLAFRPSSHPGRTNIMNIQATPIAYGQSTVRRPLLALVIVALLAAMTPAVARDHDGRRGPGNRGNSHGEYRGNAYGHRPWRPNGYAQPYWQPTLPNAYRYEPPPVYYAPFPSPGINLVIPIQIR
jgi:hypothetical protein